MTLGRVRAASGLSCPFSKRMGFIDQESSPGPDSLIGLSKDTKVGPILGDTELPDGLFWFPEGLGKPFLD